MTLEDFFNNHPPYKTLFWADQEALGEVTFHKEPFGQLFSEYFFCSICQQVWGMIEYPNRHWLPVHVTCKEHTDARSEYCIPGSMLPPGYLPPAELDAYPEAFIVREFQIHLLHVTKELEL